MNNFISCWYLKENGDFPDLLREWNRTENKICILKAHCSNASVNFCKEHSFFVISLLCLFYGRKFILKGTLRKQFYDSVKLDNIPWKM